ncbi:MAG: carbon-monoxide dehydrogenase large subunit [Myxococcales bacterium]
MQTGLHTISLTLNGEQRTLAVRDDETLLDALRERLGVRSTKNGCAPQGQCGCCLALVDGAAKTTCALPARKADGKAVVTLEGVSAEERDLIARCFVATAGLQCGFCIPGLALRAKHIVDSNANPSREEIARAIDVHLCRCTGYVRVLDAIELFARVRRGETATPEPFAGGRVGEPLKRFAGEALVLGDRPYVDDLVVPGMLRGALLLSPYARARLIALDTSRAKELPGVVAVATAAEVPGERWVGLLRNDWPVFVAVGEEARYVGDVIAAVAAEDEHTARAALALIEATWEELDPVTDVDAAVLPGAPKVNPTYESNVLSMTVFSRGDVEAALAQSAHVVEGTWTTQRIEHLFLEPESALAVPDGERIHLYTQGQGVFDDRRQVAAMLAQPEERVFVELVPNGGAFGGKEDMSVQAQTALLCHLTGRPVKVTLTREESIRMHPKRHPIRMRYRVGCDAEGRLTAVWANMVGDTGCYASVGSKVLERAAGHACGPYRVPAVHVEATAVATNNPPCGAMRGFGANQAAFAMEGALDRLAERVGMDAWQIRWLNAVEVGDMTATGQVLEKSVGLKRTLEAVKGQYDAERAAGRAVGIACGIKNSGLGNGAVEHGKARLAVGADGTVGIYNGFTEMGQGLFTILTQCAVEVTGLPPEVFRPRVDSTHPLPVGQTTGSRATLLGGRAVEQAAQKLKAALDAGRTLGELAGEVFAGDIVIDDTTKPGYPRDGRIKTHTTYAFATQVVVLDETGRVARVVAAHDVGRAINPDLCAAQVEGSIHMGLGYALTEDLPCEDGMPVTFKLREIGVLRARDMPSVDVILVEEPEPEGPFGAKGVGEIGLVPTAGAVAGALHAYDGIWRDTLPMKGSPASDAMSVGRIKGRRR